MNDNYTIQKARILLRKDATSNWESNLGQVLGNGEVAFLEPVPGDSIGRMIVGDGTNNLRALINSEANVVGGDYSSMEFASWLDPLERSRLHAVFYSGIGAGYTLPAASKDLLGGIKIDNSMFKMEGDILKLSQFEIRYEEGKGSVIHIPYSNLEVDNTLYTHTVKATDHYKDLGIFVDLNKEIKDNITTLMNQEWRFYERLNNRDLTTISMENIPFTVKVPINDTEFDYNKFNKIHIIENNILFTGEDGADVVVYSDGNWTAECFRTIIFDKDPTISEYRNKEYINSLLKWGYPLKDDFTLKGKTWKFNDLINWSSLNSDVMMEDIPFIVKVPIGDGKFEETSYNGIHVSVSNRTINFINSNNDIYLPVYSGTWIPSYFKTIVFNDNYMIENYYNVDYIDTLLKIGSPVIFKPLPLNSADRLFGGVILNNYKYDDSENKIGPHHGFIGLNYDGTPLYSKDFNIDFPQFTYDVHYLLHSGSDILYGDFKNRILKIDENGTEVTPTFFVTELNSRIKSDGKIELGIELPKENGSNQGSITFKHGKITKFTPKTTSELPEKLISAIVYDEYGHITNYTTDAYCINRIKNTYTKKETDDKITTVSGNVSDLNQKVDSWDSKWQDRVESITQGTQIQVTSEGSNDGTTFKISHGSVGESKESRGGLSSVLRSISWDENGHVVECVAETRDAFVLKQDTDYQNLLNDYNILKSQYDNLLARIEALEK